METGENGEITWESYATHHIYDPSSNELQFRAPKYRDLFITKPVTVLIQMRRMLDLSYSEGVTYWYVPVDKRPPKLDSIEGKS